MRRSEADVALVDKEINVSSVRRCHGHIGASIAGHIRANNSAQFVDAGLKMRRRAERAGPRAEIERDRSVRVREGDVGISVAVEIRRGDSFRTIYGICGENVGVARFQARRERLKIIEKLR